MGALDCAHTDLRVGFLLRTTDSGPSASRDLPGDCVPALGDLPWDSTLWDTGSAQTSLTIVWSLFGVISWVMGSRQHNRRVWGLGAAIMAVVLLKLVVIDRTHLGDLAGIGSFIGFGLLCLLVGYLAPAPPAENPPPKPQGD